MRIGSNPNSNKIIRLNEASHRVIIPIYIPNKEGYFKDSFDVLKVCIKSLLLTINKDTAVTLISNGSSEEVNDYINDLYSNGKIDRAVFNKENVGKMNAIITETRASFEEFITYSDADVFFDKQWLFKTFQMFKNCPQAGFVSMNPMPGSYGHATSAILGNLLNFKKNKIQVKKICQYEDLKHFHKSIGRDENATENIFLKNALFFEKNNLKYLIGAGHFCCTIRKSPLLKYVPKEKTYIGAAGGTEALYLDIPFDKTSLWRLSSPKAYVWHMGNTLELDWSNEKLQSISNFSEDDFMFSTLPFKNITFSSFIFPYSTKKIIVALLKKLKII